MKNNLVVLLAFVSISFCQCSKEGSIRKAVIGEWTFRSMTSKSFPYPSMLSNAPLLSMSAATSTSNGVRVSFNSDGHFTFFNYDKPAQFGQFKIYNDTLLVIQPDTSGFLNFCLHEPRIYSVSTLLPFSVPELKIIPISDTIRIRKISREEIQFALSSLKKAQVSLHPSTDTLIYTEVLSTFRR